MPDSWLDDGMTTTTATPTITADDHLARYGGQGPYAPTKDDYYGIGYIAINAGGAAWTDPMRTSIPRSAGWWLKISGATRYETIEQAAAVNGVVEIIALNGEVE